MKKLMMIICMICTLLSGCAQDQITEEPTNDVVYQGKIAVVENQQVYLVNDENLDLISLSLNDITLTNQKEKDMTIEEIQAGMKVEISYDGMIMESYPARLSQPKSLKVIDQEADLVGMYRELVKEVYEMDPALNGETYIAFDLENENNLSDGEKAALTYVLGNDLQLEVLTGNYEQLCEDGYINKEDMYFVDGVLMSIQSDESDGDFNFSITKWRSGLGAIFFTDCQAKLKNHTYTYELGAFAIS